MFLDSARLLACIAAYVVSAALLGLGCHLLAATRLRPHLASRRLKVAAILLGACGLWWPGHFLAYPAAAGDAGARDLVAALLALALIACCTAAAAVASRRTLPAFAGLSVLTVLVAYVHAMFATPGLFRAGPVADGWGPGVAVVVLAAALTVLQLELPAGRRSSLVRASAALLAAMLLTLVAAAPGLADRAARDRLGTGVDGRRAGRRRRRPPPACPGRARIGPRSGPPPGSGDADRRQPDPAAHPRLFRGPARRGGHPGRRHRRPARPAVHRPRRLQAGQRHLRALASATWSSRRSVGA